MGLLVWLKGKSVPPPADPSYKQADLELAVGEKRFRFTFDDALDRAVCKIKLSSWAGFRSANGHGGSEGEDVLLLLESGNYDSPPELAPISIYEEAIGWLLAHDFEIRDAILRGVLGFVDVMRNEWGIRDEELDTVSTTEHLTSMLDPSLIRVFPISKDGVPYFGYEFECNWDPEHGCGVLVHGSAVVSAGIGESAQALDAIEDHVVGSA